MNGHLESQPSRTSRPDASHINASGYSRQSKGRTSYMPHRPDFESKAGQKYPSPTGFLTSSTCEPDLSGKNDSVTPCATASLISGPVKYGRRKLSASGK